MVIETVDEYLAKGGEITICPTRKLKEWRLSFKHPSTVWSKGAKRTNLKENSLGKDKY